MNNETLIAVGIVVALVATIIILSVVISKLRRKIADIEFHSRTELDRVKAQAEKDIKDAHDNRTAVCSALKRDCTEKIEAADRECAEKIEAANRECAVKIEATNQECKLKIDTAHEECEEKIRKEREYIESHRDALSKMSEQELLANIMIALEGYSGRFDRLGESLNHEQITSKIDDIAKKAAEQMDVVVRTTTAKVDQLSNSIVKHMESLDIGKKIDSMASSITEHMAGFDVTQEVAGIKTTVTDIKESMEYHSMTDSTENTLDSIESSLSSLQSDINSIQSDIDSIKSSCDDARSAAEDAKNAIESHVNGY